jgi:hypothetical protein
MEPHQRVLSHKFFWYKVGGGGRRGRGAEVKAREDLVNRVKDTALYKSSALRLGRPNFAETMNDHLLGLVNKDKMNRSPISASTSSLVAFCGGPIMGNVINSATQDAVAAVKMVAGDSYHKMEFVQENYGHGTVPSKNKQ